MLATGSTQSVDLYEAEGCLPGHMNFMVYSFGEPIALSEALPLLEDMGVDVYTEHPYEATLQSGETLWIQDFLLRHESEAPLDIEEVEIRFLHFPRPRRRDGRGAVEDVAPSRRPGGPMTYRVGGRQVVVISAGGATGAPRSPATWGTAWSPTR